MNARWEELCLLGHSLPEEVGLFGLVDLMRDLLGALEGGFRVVKSGDHGLLVIIILVERENFLVKLMSVGVQILFSFDAFGALVEPQLPFPILPLGSHAFTLTGAFHLS